MSGFGILLHKEWREALRTAKLIWLPAVFLLLGLLQPLTAKFMPDILASAGNLPEGTLIQIPVPTPGEVLGQTISQFGTVGLLAVCLAFMGTIAGEKRNGTADWILVKPVSPLAYVASKWVVLCLIVAIAFGLGFGGSWYYTNLLIGVPNSGDALISAFLYYIWLVFIGTVTIMTSALLRSPAAAAFITFGGAIVLQLVHGLFDNKLSWLPSGLDAAAISKLATGSSPSWAGSAIVTGICIATLLTVAAKGAGLRKKG
ncbi:ABC transporter permease [Cohnella cholangitidis]|uniref:ABC transporter permease subunit n=1 Tax=Cohnella cholangitidis TaxID=2598458 RepID=A0A7G5BVP3_9BACL|nr:ABC transporter permease subunit [Cohnella cholangitidis]QMV41027.1 ABC transporter permease subunit [Cohnella cholangitidis]